MRVLVDIEIETADYGGKEFKEEIEKLIHDIDPNTRLILFKMRAKGIHINDERDFEWQEDDSDVVDN